jgi:hypothetical protein
MWWHVFSLSSCGATTEYCDNALLSNGNCKTQGCPSGQCCSAFGL